MKNSGRDGTCFFSVMLGAAFPLLGGLLAITLWFYTVRDESIAPYVLIAGIVAGLIIDLLFLKRWKRRIYDLPLLFMVGIFAFYHAGIYGTFMGFPGFNLLLAIPTGVYFARRFHPDQKFITARSVPLASTLILALFCIATTVLLLLSSHPETELENMLNGIIRFTPALFWMLYTAGTLLLLLFNYGIVRRSFLYTLKKTNI